MALYDSNDRYTCVKCGYDIFEEKEMFLLEKIADKTKLTTEINLVKSTITKKVVCSSCKHPVHKEIK